MTETTTPDASPSGARDHDRDYLRLREHVARRLAAARGPIFTTDADGSDERLYALYLDGIDASLRPQYTCSACRHFIRTFGGLVTLDEQGRPQPLFWPGEGKAGADGTFADAMRGMRERVASARITGVFVFDKPVWGRPQTGEWQHLGGAVHETLVFKHPLLSAGQRGAELIQDHETLSRALDTYDRKHLKVALRLLNSEQLYRSEKVLGVAKWLDALMASLEQGGGKAGKKGSKKAGTSGGKKAGPDSHANRIWLAVATAPAGFCHVRSSMIGTLLDDIAAGKSYADVERAFAAKMHPLQYQRPQAAPSAGNIREAEAIIAKLGSQGALARRFARLDDLQLLWRSPAVEASVAASVGAAVGRVFDHLLPGRRAAPALDGLPSKTLTWEKFRRTVLPEAGRIEIEVGERGGFYAFLTAADAEAIPIVQWDLAERRNPVTWYTYMEPSAVKAWNLEPGWRAVTGICLFPHQWADEEAFSHQQKGALMVIEGCRAPEGGGSGLFPEFLRTEYRAIRATMEAFSKAATVAGRDAAGACGLAMRPGASASLRLRVHSPEGDAVMVYVIDRWD